MALVAEYMNYRILREQLYRPLKEKAIFTWDTIENVEYALATVYPVTPEFRQELGQAAARLGAIYTKIVPVIQKADNQLLAELGIPPEAWQAVRTGLLPGSVTTMGRFDFAATDQGLKMLEFNSETPAAVVEAYYVNDAACRLLGAENPNDGMDEHIFQAFQASVRQYRDQGYCTDNIYFTALGWHEEDAGTARYLLSRSGLSARFVAIADLRVLDDRLWVKVEERLLPVDVLYRLYPLEQLATERDTDGYPTGAHVLDLIARHKLAVINPPSACLAQSKALQALIWNLHETGEFFSAAEHAIIEKYMLPTYMENRFQGLSQYVVKPLFGREGGAVTIFDESGRVIDKDYENLYWEQSMVYQQFVQLPPVSVNTLAGFYQGYLLWSSFLVGGQPSAIAARVGGPITNDLAYFLPVGIKA